MVVVCLLLLAANVAQESHVGIVPNIICEPEPLIHHRTFGLTRDSWSQGWLISQDTVERGQPGGGVT